MKKCRSCGHDKSDHREGLISCLPMVAGGCNCGGFVEPFGISAENLPLVWSHDYQKVIGRINIGPDGSFGGFFDEEMLRYLESIARESEIGVLAVSFMLRGATPTVVLDPDMSSK